MDFILGIILGIILLGVFRVSYQVYQAYTTLNKPLDLFINSDISKFTFVDRRNTLVKIQYNESCYLAILIDTKSVNIFMDDKLVIYLSDENRKKMIYLFDKLMDGFYTEIYTDIVTLNGNVFSNNLFIKDKEYTEDFDESMKIKILNPFTPTIDDILDKINKTGMGSLTSKELNILKKNT